MAEDEEGQVDAFDLVDLDDRWVPSSIWWDGKYASEIMKQVPVEDFLAGDARAAFLDFLVGHLSWTILKLKPPWIKPGRRDRSSVNLHEWTHRFGRALGLAIGALPPEKAQQHFIAPILALEGEQCWDLLAPLVDSYVCRHVYDAQAVPADGPNRLLAFLDKVLVLLCHKTCDWIFLRRGTRQHGQRLSVLARATVSLRRMVAIEFVTCRSGRRGGRVGSSTRGNDSLLELAGCAPS